MSNILSEIKLKSNSIEVLDMIDNALNESFKTNTKNKFIDKLPFEIDSKKDISSQLTSIKKEIEDSNIIHLVIATDYTEDLINSLYNWFKDNGFKNFLLDIKIDKSILGGIQVNYEGKFIDLSLVTKVKNYAK